MVLQQVAASLPDRPPNADPGTAVALSIRDHSSWTLDTGTGCGGRMNVMVISARAATGRWLADRLTPVGIEVTMTEPGPDVVRLAREHRPQVAVLDGIESRPQLARMEVALLKDQSPGVRVIALSAAPSEADAEVVEQGVFCYLGGCSLEELLRVVESAARGTP